MLRRYVVILLFIWYENERLYKISLESNFSHVNLLYQEKFERINVTGNVEIKIIEKIFFQKNSKLKGGIER